MQHPTREVRPSGVRRRAAWLLPALLALSMVAAACASDGGDGAGLSGSIVISGSSTVEPVSIAVAEKFQGVEPDVDIAVDGPGTGDGFELFCNGDTDISDASRAIAEQEIATCESNGIEYIEMKVAIDGIAVLTSPNNDVIGDCLTFEQIYALVGPESQGFDQWSDANSLAGELGADPFENADVGLEVTAPGEESGTYDSFVELVLEGFAEERGQEPQTRPDYQASADDNVIVQGITGSDYSFGWVGFAFYEENRDQLKAFEIDGGDGCVAPTPDTIADGSYPISRPLFIYANTARVEESEALTRFIDYYLSDEGIASATEVGYVALEPDELEATRTVWESRETGTREA